MPARLQAGYSLIELLVVLALMGLIAVAIAGGMRTGTAVWQRTEAAVEGGEVARGGHAVLRTLLSHIYPRRRDATQAEELTTFTGNRGRMEFVAVAPSSLSAPGLVRVALTAAHAGNSTSLSLSYRAEQGPNDERSDVLLSGAREITFAYAQLSDSDIVWRDDWQGQAAPPTLIRIRVAFPPGRGLNWPDLIVRPLIDKDAACIYDPVSFDCRHG
jgi:general secretion pathway protein J